MVCGAPLWVVKVTAEHLILDMANIWARGRMDFIAVSFVVDIMT